MKIKAIAQIINRSKTLTMSTISNVTWIGNADTLYPLYGLPVLDMEQVFNILDIPEDIQGKFVVYDTPTTTDLSDNTDDEVTVQQFPLLLTWKGETYLPLLCTDGIVFICNSYLRPFDDDIVLFERKDAKGGTFIAVKQGLYIVGRIDIAPIITGTFAEGLDIMSGLVKERCKGYENM